jgi:hypothetical protein
LNGIEEKEEESETLLEFVEESDDQEEILQQWKDPEVKHTYSQSLVVDSIEVHPLCPVSKINIKKEDPHQTHQSSHLQFQTNFKAGTFCKEPQKMHLGVPLSAKGKRDHSASNKGSVLGEQQTCRIFFKKKVNTQAVPPKILPLSSKEEHKKTQSMFKNPIIFGGRSASI